MPNLKSKRIYIVDDDPFWSELLKGILHSIGYLNVLSFDSGESCLDHLGHQPEIIFLDYKMKNSDGIETLKKLKERNKDLFVVFTTSMEDIDVAVKAMKLGSFDFFLKSTASELTVQNILSNIKQSYQKPGQDAAVY